MDLKQTLKALFVGFCFGFGLTWLLAIILPFTMGVSNIGKFLRDCGGDIFSYSIFGAFLMSLFWLIGAASSQKRKKREALEDEMREYFRRQKEKSED